MRRLVCAASLVLAVVIPAAAAQAKAPTHRHAAVYEYVYRHVVAKLGRRAPGRNIVKDGTRRGAATDAQVLAATHVMERLEYPPPAYTPTASGTATSYAVQAPAAYSSSGASGGYTIPSGIVQCESHGNYRAVNPSSGAGGAYQILPSTWAAYGGQGAPQDAPPAEQDRIAGEIWANQGPGAWVC